MFKNADNEALQVYKTKLIYDGVYNIMLPNFIKGEAWSRVAA